MRITYLKQKKRSIVRLISLTVSFLTVLSLSGCLRALREMLPDLNERDRPGYGLSDIDSYQPVIQTKLDFDVVEQSEPLEIEYYLELYDNGGIRVYDTAYLDKLFDASKIGKQELLQALNGNDGISPKYKQFIAEYIELLFERYPDNNYRIFYENLKNLKVVECKDSFELFDHTLSMDSFACFVAKEDTIYTLDGYEYKKGTWEYQVIMHEISHALRTYWDEPTNNHAQFPDLTFTSVIEEEAMNSIFTVSLFDYEERDIAYQLQSNIFQIFVSSMDNYDLNDYVNHSTSYFVRKLDEFTGHTNYAFSILKVMEAQYDDYHSDYIELEESEFYPLYDFICEVYLKNKLNDETTENEKEQMLKGLVDAVIYDVPAEYHIDTDYFMHYFQRIGGSSADESGRTADDSERTGN